MLLSYVVHLNKLTYSDSECTQLQRVFLGAMEYKAELKKKKKNQSQMF